MLGPSYVGDTRQWWRRLGRSAVSRLVLSVVGAFGAGVGERLVDALFEKDEDSDEDAAKPQEGGES